MRLYIADEEKLNVYDLPEIVDESFLFSYTPKLTNVEVFLNIYSNVGTWFFKNDESINIINSDKDMPLKPFDYFNLKIFGSTYTYHLFTYPSTNENYKDLKISSGLTEGIKIGCNKTNNIILDSLQNDIDSTIIEENGLCYIVPFNEKSNAYLNRRKLIDKTLLNVGDVIFVENLKIVWMKDFIRVYSCQANPYFSNNIVVYENPAVNNNDYLNYDAGDNDISLYKEDSIFYTNPRLRTTYTPSKITIDDPPAKAVKEEVPFIFSIGSSGTMLVFGMFSVYNAVNNYDPSVGFNMKVIMPIIQAVVMILCSVLLPQILKLYTKRKNKKKDKIREEKYTEYLTEKKIEIDKELKQQKESIFDNNLSSEQCYEMIIGNKSRLWEREIEDKDFLTVRVGVGTVPAEIDIEAPRERFELDRDDLVQKAIDIVNASKFLDNVPITVSLCENRFSSIVCNTNFKDQYIDGIVLQLLSMYAPNELRIIILTNKDNMNKWEYLKASPYIFSLNNKIRYFCITEEESKNALKDLEDVYAERLSQVKESDEDDKESNKQNLYVNYKPYYLIITDDYRRHKDSNLIKRIFDSDKNLGFSILIIENSIKHLPNECKKYINVTDKVSSVFEKDYDNSKQTNFAAEYSNNIDKYRAIKEIANIPMPPVVGDEQNLPTTLSFLEMYNVGNIEQLGILNRWTQSNSIVSLSCPIGVHPSGDVFKLDLHEKFHGPHGLIAGSTGSGKSEFIITYILSMAINYHPDDVQFVLIDYKGGGLAGAFENREKGISIPHLAGTITNLDVSEMNRALVSIESELKRRQAKFNEARDLLGESTIDIYKYQKYYKEGILKEPIPHLFIISDEFAELKSQQPDFMDELISTARIGRSLGVHLILATQKPSGVVNDQIWSNSKFKVCLKVQTKQDSMEMLKRPEAASIKETGRFYLQVGYDELFELGQSAWAGSPYIPSKKVIKKYDDSISFVNNVGEVVKSINNVVVQKEAKEDKGEQLTNIVKYLYDLGVKNNIKTRKLWLDSIPAEIYLSNVSKKYNYTPKPYEINPVIGELDSPATQQQGLLTLNISKNGNTLIYGVPGSGKENLITTIITSICIQHTTDEINIYIIDYGSETLRKFKDFPQVGDVVLSDEKEKLNNLSSILYGEINKRKELFANYSGNYEDYLKESKNKLNSILVIINGYDNFSEADMNMADRFTSLFKDGPKFGINFIVASSITSSVGSKMQQLFNNKIALKLANADDYRFLFGAPRGLVPADYFGRGVVRLDNTYEFQTAYISQPDNINATIKALTESLNKQITKKAPKVPVLPRFVLPTMINSDNLTLDDLPVGISYKNLNVVGYDFLKYNITPILASSIKSHINFIYGLIEVLKKMSMIKIRIIDALGIYEKTQGVDLFNDDFDTRLKQIKIEINNDDKKVKTNLFIIIGLESFKNKINKETNDMFADVFSNCKKYTKNVFIVFDDYNSYRSLEMEIWFKQAFNASNGIWLGENATTQLSIKMPNITNKERKIDFPQIGFVVSESSHNIIKYIVDEEINNEE